MWKHSGATALAAILNHFRPIDPEVMASKADDPPGRLSYVFRLYEEAGVPALLDPEDLLGPQVADKKSVMTFLICAFQVLAGLPPAASGGTTGAAVAAAMTSATSDDADGRPGKFFFRQILVLPRTKFRTPPIPRTKSDHQKSHDGGKGRHLSSCIASK